MLIIALAAFTAGIAQNTNEKEVKTVKKTIVTDADGVEVQTKATTKLESQDLALVNPQGKHNFSTVMEPKEVTTDVDYYNSGIKYRFMPEKTGYYIVNTEDTQKRLARLYPTSQKGYYIYTKDGVNSMGYFNADGDFVVESYDPDGDGVMNYVYKIKMDKDTKKKMKKMKKMK